MIAVKSRLFRVSLFVALFMTLGLTLASCGGGGAQTGETGHQAATSKSVALDLKFPAGYSYNRAKGELSVPGAQTSRIPSYVTRITLTITGDGIAPITVDVPLDTLAVTVFLSAGTYTFTLTVYTSIGLTFTGTATGVIGPVAPPPVSFDLVVNSPPTLDSLTVGSGYITIIQQTTLSAVASDLDPDDTLAYQWSASGGSIAGNGNTATFSSGTPGTYTVTVTVSDGRGGTATGSAQVNVRDINHSPAISALTLDGEEYYYTYGNHATWHKVAEFDPAVSFYNQGGAGYNTCDPSIGAGNYVPFQNVDAGDNKIQISCVAADPDGNSLTYALMTTFLDATLSPNPAYLVTSVIQTVVDPADASIVSAVNSFKGPVYVWDVSPFVNTQAGWGWNTYSHVYLMDVTCTVSDGRGGVATRTNRYATKTPGCS